jgi:hypothetical protein
VSRGRALARTAWGAADGPLRLLAGVTLGAAAVIALHALFVPVRHVDSVIYHLPRIGFYLQQGSLDAFPTPDLRQTALPVDAEILVLWQTVLSGRLLGAPLAQVLCWLGTSLAVFRLARDLGADLRGAAFAGLAFASLPVVVLETTTVQNDLVMAFFVACALVFARSGVAQGRAGHLAVAGAAFGLALGTKAVAALAAPALLGLVVAESIRAGRPLWRRAVLLALSCAIGVLSLGSYIYVQNLRVHGHAAGSRAFADMHALPRFDGRVAWANLGRLALRLSEPAGLVPPGTRAAAWLERVHARFAARARGALGIEARLPEDFMRGEGPQLVGLPIDPDLTTFGPLLAFAGVPVLAYTLLRRRIDPAARALALGAVTYLVGVAVLLRYNFHLGRFLIAMAAMGAPLLAVLYRDGRTKAGRFVNGVLAAVCMATLLVCTARATSVTVAPADGAPGDAREADAAALLFGRLPPGRVALWTSGAGRDPIAPLFYRSLSRPVRTVRAGDAGEPALLRDADYVLVWGDGQLAIRLGDPGADPGSWFEFHDLQPLLAQLRQPGSGWHTLVDGPLYPPGGFVLCARRTLSGAERAALPDVLPWSQSTLARGAHFLLPVRLDAARPVLVVRGEAMVPAPVMIAVSGPAGEPLVPLTPVEGAFALRVPLDPLVAADRAPYAVVAFQSSGPWRTSGIALASR